MSATAYTFAFLKDVQLIDSSEKNTPVNLCTSRFTITRSDFWHICLILLKQFQKYFEVKVSMKVIK